MKIVYVQPYPVSRNAFVLKVSVFPVFSWNIYIFFWGGGGVCKNFTGNCFLLLYFDVDEIISFDYLDLILVVFQSF